MTEKAHRVSAVLTLAVAVCCGAWLACRSSQPLRVTLRLHPLVGEEVLRLDQVRYANPGGDGFFKVRAFQLFVSNVRLVGDSAEFLESESYHLARFDSDEGIYDIVIENVPKASYQRVELGIGVDSAANGSLATTGDLDPNGRMAWNWEVGYKFVLFEGGLVIGDSQYPLVYHVGFAENYKQVSFDLNEPLSHDATLDFHIDLLTMFNGAQTVDMSALPNVKFDRADAKLLADNYARMISLCKPQCVH